jgi:ribosomal-protein-alanine N-acetyltransferase
VLLEGLFSLVAVKNSTVRIRDMNRHDLPDVLRIERASYNYPWSESIFHDCLATGYSCWVAVVKENISGYGIFQFAAGEAHILNLCVEPAQRQMGYARYLLHSLFNAMKNSDIHTVYLEVRPSNIAAIKLYDGEGFNEVGVRKNYYRANSGKQDALILARYLDWG